MSEKRFKQSKYVTPSSVFKFFMVNERGFNIFDGNNKKLSPNEIVDKLNEQQDTIFKLQDLCGKSDGENAKLRNEIKLLKPTNIEQYEQIQKLQEENEKLRKELGDCEKFRYTVFKRLNDEYIKECSIR